MKLRTIFLVAMLASLLGIRAQKLTVEKMAVAPMDLSASQYERKDLNGKPCGLVKVQLATMGATFEGNVIGKADYKTGEYWVYMSEGSYMLTVKHPSFVPLNVNFRDYDINGVKSKTTYVLTLLMPQAGPVNVDNGMRYLTLIVSPVNSKVTIDGQVQDVDSDGSVSAYLPQGTHQYQVEARGYASKSGRVTIGSESVTERVTLESVLATVRVNCPTAGAQIYVNNQLKGTTPWSGTLAAGTYQMEARLTGYRSQKVTESLAERSNREIELPALQAIVGNLNVNYKPAQSEVWVDGKKLGVSPDVFRNLQVGRHDVEVRKGGYVTKKETVTIAEGQTAILTGSLESQAQPTVAANNSVASAGQLETITVKGVSFNMVRVEGGTFRMGSDDGDAYDDEKPVHQVTLSTYSIGETEVTQELWEAVMGSNPSRFNGAKRPVESVNWDDCQEFIRKLNQATGKKFRLPTEAEWEYAARGGNRSRGFKYAGSNTIADVAVYYGNSYNKGESSPDYGTHPVKTKQANELGLYDMSGNVWEWCQDRYGNYSGSAQTNPTGASSGSNRVYRGGSWFNGARYCRSSIRNDDTPSNRSDGLGLRLAL